MKWPSWKRKGQLFSVLGYSPTQAQEPVHQSKARIIIVGGGERAGKSKIAAMECVARIFACDGRPIFLVGEKYERCVPEFDYISEALLDLGLVTVKDISRPADGQQRCTIKVRRPHLNTTIMTVSAVKGMTAVRASGRAPALILMCEGGLMSYEVELACRGRLAEARGALIVTGSFPDDVGWMAQKYEDYQHPNKEMGESFSIPSWSNTAIYPGGRQDPEILAVESAYPELDFLRFIGALPQPPATIVYPEFRYSMHVPGTVKFDPDEQVWLAIDPGYRGAYAVIAYQFSGPYVLAIDEVYRWAAKHGKGAYGEAVIEECMKREWWPNVIDGVIDIAGLQHHGAESQVEIWAAKTMGKLPARPGPDEALRLKYRKVIPFEGRQRLRTFLADPASGEALLRLSTKCEHFAREFGLYRFKEIVEGRPIDEEPIPRDNHAIKATEYLLFFLYGRVEWPTREVEPRKDRWEVYGHQRRRKDYRRYGE